MAEGVAGGEPAFGTERICVWTLEVGIAVEGFLGEAGGQVMVSRLLEELVVHVARYNGSGMRRVGAGELTRSSRHRALGSCRLCRPREVSAFGQEHDHLQKGNKKGRLCLLGELSDHGRKPTQPLNLF